MAPSQPNGQGSTEISFVISEQEWNRLEEIAYEESSPGDMVNISQVARDAIRSAIQRDDAGNFERDPRGRGDLWGGITVDVQQKKTADGSGKDE